MAMHTVAKPFRHEQNSYAKGDPIELDDKTAKMFEARGMIGEPDADKGQARKEAIAKMKEREKADADALRKKQAAEAKANKIRKEAETEAKKTANKINAKPVK